jgi:hypothetical protein
MSLPGVRIGPHNLAGSTRYLGPPRLAPLFDNGLFRLEAAFKLELVRLV